MAKKKKNKPRVEFAHRNALRGAKHPFPLLSNIRKTASISDFKDLLIWIHSNPFIRTKLFPGEYPKTVADLTLGPSLSAMPTNREFRWASAYLQRASDNLSEFVSLSRLYSHSLLANDFVRGKEILANIEMEFGQSLWLIKNRLAFLHLTGGLEAQKQYAKEIKESAEKGGIAAYVAYFVSLRNESTVSPVRFSSIFEHHLASLHLAPVAELYLRHHLFPQLSYSEPDIGAILRYEFSTTVIDYYEAFLRMCQIAVCSRYHNLYPDIAAALHMLSAVTDDRLGVLLFELDGTKPRHSTHNTTAMKQFDQFLRGKTIPGFDHLMDGQHNLDQIDELEIGVRANADKVDQEVRDSNDLFGFLKAKMSIIAALGEKTDEAMAGLQKIWLNHNSQTWAQSILDFARKEGSPEPPEECAMARQFAALNTPFLHALRVSAYTDRASRTRYATLLKEVYGESLSTIYAETRADTVVPESISDIVPLEQQLLKAESYLDSNNFGLALDEAIKLESSASPYYQKHGVRIRSVCLLGLERLPECLEVITRAFVRRHQLHHVLPICRVVEAIDTSQWTQLAGSLALSVAFDMYSRHVGTGLDEFRNYAYEDFLTNNDLYRPSQIQKILPSLDKPSAIYFLRNICVENIMDTSTAFENSNDVTEERLSVLRVLVDIDPEHVEDYHREIKEIQSRLMIKRRLREVEQSKIYVDVEGIKLKVDKNMRESFSRYRSYLKHGLDADSAAYREAAHRKAVEGDIEGLLSLTLPQNEMTELFRSMIVELRDEFVSSPDHGLNWFLSVRIRHGTFSGHLRSPLEAGYLITQRDRLTDEYKSNVYWLEKLDIEDPTDVQYLNDCFTEFSRAFDELVQQVLSDWLQIKKEHADRGMFNFMLSETQVDLMSSSISENSTYEHFLDEVFEFLTARLAGNLDSIRERIELHAEPRVRELLNSLLGKITLLAQSVDIRDLSNTITAARTEMHVAFDRVIEWFRPARTTTSDPFLIEDAVNISIASVRIFSPTFTAHLAIDNEFNRQQFHGKQLSTVVDIFFIIFENIVRHSDAETPHAEVTMVYEGNAIHFHIDNPISPTVNNEQSRAKIEKLQAAMKERRSPTSLSTEGGTGLLKIWRIIAHDFGEEPRLVFGFGDNENFFVDFTVSTKEGPL